jgi:hypothetical protein
VREAIEECYAVLMLASPASRESLYVRGELKVAESEAVRIIPLWVEGDKWVDSVPLSMTYGQYIDIRESNRSEALRANIAETLLASLITEQGGKDIQHEEHEDILFGPGRRAQW